MLSDADAAQRDGPGGGLLLRSEGGSASTCQAGKVRDKDVVGKKGDVVLTGCCFW